jgi:predicted CoA-substrate-specific enzyme activase
MGYFLGIDIGSTLAKGVLLDEAGAILVQKHIRTKPQHNESVKLLLEAIQSAMGFTGESRDLRDQLLACVGTGYGRNNIDIAQKSVTEIQCHARGVWHFFPTVRTIIDIGGQDSKVIRLEAGGRVSDFVMNEKCAAGTGRFLEMAGKIFKVPLAELGPISLRAKTVAQISSTCVVFAESEIISLLAEGTPYESIIRGIHCSVVSRLLGMGQRIGLVPPLVFTGGVAENRGIVAEIITQLGIQPQEIQVPTEPKYTGALGAAILAREGYWGDIHKQDGR